MSRRFINLGSRHGDYNDCWPRCDNWSRYDNWPRYDYPYYDRPYGYRYYGPYGAYSPYALYYGTQLGLIPPELPYYYYG